MGTIVGSQRYGLWQWAGEGEEVRKMGRQWILVFSIQYCYHDCGGKIVQMIKLKRAYKYT